MFFLSLGASPSSPPSPPRSSIAAAAVVSRFEIKNKGHARQAPNPLPPFSHAKKKRREMFPTFFFLSPPFLYLLFLLLLFFKAKKKKSTQRHPPSPPEHSQNPWIFSAAFLTILLSTRNADALTRWSPCSWMIAPSSASSTTVPLQQNSFLKALMIFL